MQTPIRHPAILAVSLTPVPILEDGAQWVSSALACLDQAASQPFDMVLIRGTVARGAARADLVELVQCLRHHPACEAVPVLAVLDDWHRDLIADLEKAGLNWVDVRPGQEALVPSELFDLATRYPVRFDIRRLLSRLCPYLNASVFEGDVEVTTCGACGNRLVLGGQRLRSVCRTPGHRHCGYFKEARQQS